MFKDMFLLLLESHQLLALEEVSWYRKERAEGIECDFIVVASGLNAIFTPSYPQSFADWTCFWSLHCVPTDWFSV
uniref:Putative secreted protein n=1 Tax=Anopheles darlingi TaxID=43151 RepID=A0A2M4D992_ANODA